MSDNNSSGYAIRTDLLGMAIGILEAKKSREEANEHIQADNDKSYRRQKNFTALSRRNSLRNRREARVYRCLLF